MNDPALYPHAQAIIERLESVLPSLTTPVSVGNHRNVYADDPDRPVAPSCVLYLRPGGIQSGPLCSPTEDAWLPFQLTCIGDLPEQAMWVADQAHAALISSPLQVEDRSICRLKRTWFGASAQRDETLDPPLFYVPVEYRLWSVPALAGS